MQHDGEDSGLRFHVREESTLCLGDHRLRTIHTISDKHPERLKLELEGPLFYLSVETYQICVRTCQINRPKNYDHGFTHPVCMDGCFLHCTAFLS